MVTGSNPIVATKLINKYKIMLYNEWGDENPTYEALKEMYDALKSSDEWAGVRYESARERYEELNIGDSYQGGL